MVSQADLVRATTRLTPLGTYKGTDEARRRHRGRGWRPDEER